MMQRSIESKLREKLAESKIIVLRGPKQTGRKTLLSTCIDLENEQVALINCGNKKIRKELDEIAAFQNYVAGKKVIVLEEAQYLTELQAIIDFCIESDAIASVILICSFEPQLQEELWEALRYQKLEIKLLPLSYTECAQTFGVGTEEKNIEQRLIFGYYPSVVAEPEIAENTLLELVESAIFTQLGASDRINKKEQLIKLLRLLAFNIGNVISYNDLGQKCDLDNETVERYIKLLEKADILFLLPSYHNGNRYEMKKSNRVFFVDNGIRNALIRSFQPFEFRNDSAALWENWVLSERRKANLLHNREPESYFWLTHTKQEIDYLEFSESGQYGYVIQWEKKKNIKIPASFVAAYPTIKVTGINRSTFWTFLQKK